MPGIRTGRRLVWLAAIMLAAGWAAGVGAQDVVAPVKAPSIAREPANPKLPSLFIVSDSTADFHPDRDHEGAAAIQGWGDVMAAFFDTNKVNVVNVARGGRSSRTYRTEGLWDKDLAMMKPGDIVLIQLGQNDVFPTNDAIARGTIPGVGDETEEIENQATHQHETVHTFGWYVRKYVEETKAVGALPVVMSLTPRNVWKDGHIEIGVSGYREWSHTIASKEPNTDYVDVSGIMAREYEKLGQAKTAGMFHTREPVHMTEPGAFLAAQCVVSGLKGLLDGPVMRYLSPLGEQVTPMDELAFHWPADPKLPTLWILGDSTVRNGDGTGAMGLWGWGDEIGPAFDAGKLNVSNVAVSGISARTYYAMHWPLVSPSMKAGDFLMMQFGHNDGGDPMDKGRSRADLPGIGEETKEITNPITGLREVIHTYGWYLRQMIAEARKKGMTPLLCTSVPRKTWVGDKIKRDEHADWMAQVAKAEGVALLDINKIISAEYEQMGKQKVDGLFGDANTHQNLEGAKVNAAAVITALQGLGADPLAADLAGR